MVNLGILGLAHGHIGMYCTRWREHPEMGVQVTAGWDRDAERLAGAAAQFGYHAADSVADVLARVDAVIIGSETAFHADLVEKAAAAGKAIVLQKPMALTLDQADRIVAAVERAGVPFTLAWQMRVDPHNLKVKALLESGEFGRVYMVRRRHCLPTQQWAGFENSWHVDPAMNRDIFADDAAHPMDFLYWLLGMPVSVIAEMGTLLNPAIRNDNGIAAFRYADGAFAEVTSTFVSVAGENVTEVVCERGTIIGNYGDLTSGNIPWPAGGIQLKWFLQGASEWTVSDLPDIHNQGDRIAGLAGPIAEFLHGARPPIATAAEGRDVLRMMLACYESAGTGRRVLLHS